MVAGKLISNKMLLFIFLGFSSGFQIQSQNVTMPPTIVDHIIGGQRTIEKVWPWTAGLHLVKHGAFIICGATITSPQYVITAAHCTRKYKAHELFTSAGHIKVNDAAKEAGYQYSHVAEVIIHPEHDKSVLSNDISLLKLSNAWT